MGNNVKFFFTNDFNKYLNLAVKDPLALYFIEDAETGYCALYKGENLMAVGSNATAMASGLMSSEDKKSLDEIIASGGGIGNLQAVDGTISITDGENGKKNIAVSISGREGNALTFVDGGLFVPTAQEISVPEYAIEKQSVADEGFNATYKLKKTHNGEVSYVGDSINVAIDAVLSSADFFTVTENDVPYNGASIGDPYIDLGFNDPARTHLYVPMKGLVDQHTAGNGIKIEDNVISIVLGSDANGLHFVDGALNLALATKDTAGALSPVDKVFIDSIPELYASKKFVTKTMERIKYEISSKPAGTIVDYRENEIRVMCPADTEWVKQNVGANGNGNMYYMGFKAYAPEGAVSFKEDDQAVIADQTMYYFENNDFAGIDEFGRKYSVVWLALASYDETTGTWSYFGDMSSTDKYIGWYYTVEWYDENGVMIDADQIRINLTNAECHYSDKPYYMANYATTEQITNIENAFSWGEL